MHGDAEVPVGIGRDGGAIAHLHDVGNWRHLAGEDQGKGRRQIGGIAGFEIIGGRTALQIDTAAHIHDLGGALRLPGMFLLARQLHPDRSLYRPRQQRRVGRDVIGAIAAIAAGGFQPLDPDQLFRHVEQQRQIAAHGKRVLRPRPDR